MVPKVCLDSVDKGKFSWSNRKPKRDCSVIRPFAWSLYEPHSADCYVRDMRTNEQTSERLHAIFAFYTLPNSPLKSKTFTLLLVFMQKAAAAISMYTPPTHGLWPKIPVIRRASEDRYGYLMNEKERLKWI